MRKSEALQFAEQNYDAREKIGRLMKPSVIDTFGYVKMAFAARKAPPNFDEIEQARALFQEALVHQESLPASNSSRTRKKTFQSHLEQATRLLAGR